jgi:catechol 2,3-dioxygenase-like lactoylglutathione lyase family enzyme
MSKFLHVSLRSRGRDQTSEWYQKNLGFEERRRGTTGIGTQTAILALPASETYIEVSDREKLGHDFDIPDEAIALVIQVPDLKAAVQRLRQNGATITEGDENSDFVFVQDPDGYDVMLTDQEEVAGGRSNDGNAFASFSIRANDLDKSVKFYTEHFGWQERRRFKTDRGTNIAILELPGNDTTLAIREMPFAQPMARIPENLMHIALPVPDMQQFRQEMQAKGVPVDPDGDRMSWVVDPDGYELEIIERRPE